MTSPPFLDVVDYKGDNWLRWWFSGIDAGAVPVTVAKQVDAWQAFVTTTLVEVRRILRPGGHVAFEVGEVRGGAVRLEDVVVPAGIAAGLEPVLVMVNAQAFTKTANCWGVEEQRQGHQHQPYRAAPKGFLILQRCVGRPGVHGPNPNAPLTVHGPRAESPRGLVDRVPTAALSPIPHVCPSVRMTITPSEIAGVAMITSPIAFFASST